MPKPTDLLTRKQAAARLGLSVATLESWVFRGKGPAYLRTGERRGKVLYRAADLERWQREHTIRPSKSSSAASRQA